MPRLAFLAAFVACTAASAEIRFRDVAAEAGVKFTLRHHPTASKHMIETMPGGLAAADFDNDGRIDLFFTNGAAIPSMKKESAAYHNRLFRNTGNWRFVDATGESGLAGEGYSMGAAAADFDNDGLTDLFVAGVRANRLYRNLGRGKFADVTARAGIQSDLWSVAGGWFDYDNDGLLDLLVVNYSAWPPKADRFCGDTARKIRVYCHPKYFDPVPNQLYRNLGGGKFADVTSSSGIGERHGRGMSAAFADYDGDGRIDAFVTNDNLPNSLFRNLGGGRFEETALLAGVALLDHGKPVASMGADFRDYDNDGRPDLAVTALAGETYPLFRNEGGGLFRDATYSSGVGPATVKHSGWSVAFADFDNDGRKDLFAAQSHVNDVVEQFEASAYREPNLLLRNTASGFARVEAGLTAVAAHRGSAIADFDNDGRLDIAVSALGEPAELWRNVTDGAGRWFAVRPRGTRSNRDGIGVVVRAAGQTQHVSTTAGYASSVSAPAWFALPAGETARVEVEWPSGAKQTVTARAGAVVEAVEPR